MPHPIDCHDFIKPTITCSLCSYGGPERHDGAARKDGSHPSEQRTNHHQFPVVASCVKFVVIRTLLSGCEVGPLIYSPVLPLCRRVQMSTVLDLLRFRMLIAPYILELLFWSGIGGTIYGSYWLFVHNHWAWWLALFFGVLLTRLVFEFALLAFRSYDRLVEISKALAPDRSPDKN